VAQVSDEPDPPVDPEETVRPPGTPAGPGGATWLAREAARLHALGQLDLASNVSAALRDLVKDPEWTERRRQMLGDVTAASARVEGVLKNLTARTDAVDAVLGKKAAVRLAESPRPQFHAPLLNPTIPLPPAPATEAGLRRLSEDIRDMTGVVQGMLDATRVQVDIATMNHEATRDLAAAVKASQATAERMERTALWVAYASLGVAFISLVAPLIRDLSGGLDWGAAVISAALVLVLWVLVIALRRSARKAQASQGFAGFGSSDPPGATGPSETT
jgi:hypothetical protein